MLKGNLHGDLAAHGVAQKAGFFNTLGIQIGNDILGHGRIVHVVGMGRAAVIAFIQSMDLPAVLKPAGNTTQVFQGTK